MLLNQIASWKQNPSTFIKPLILPVSFILTAVFIGVWEWTTTDRFSWPGFWVAGVAGAIIILIRIFRAARQMVGEHGMERSTWHLCVLGIAVVLLFAPLSIYILRGQPGVATTPISQFSVIAIASTLGGLILAAAARSQWRLEFVRVAQKFILSTVLFIVFIPSIFMVDGMLDGIDINSLEWMSPKAWIRTMYFLLAASCFFIGILLFLAGLVDLMFALSRLHGDAPASEPVP